MIKIRKFKKGDEQKLSYLSRRCVVLINSKDMSEEQMINMCRHFTPSRFVEYAKRFRVYVAEEGGRLVGTATLDENWIRAVFVNPKYHRKGIGTEIMDYLENIAQKHGLKSISLKASPFAVNFYKKRNYKKIKNIKTEVGSVTVMKKNL